MTSTGRDQPRHRAPAGDRCGAPVGGSARSPGQPIAPARMRPLDGSSRGITTRPASRPPRCQPPSRVVGRCIRPAPQEMSTELFRCGVQLIPRNGLEESGSCGLALAGENYRRVGRRSFRKWTTPGTATQDVPAWQWFTVARQRARRWARGHPASCLSSSDVCPMWAVGGAGAIPSRHIAARGFLLIQIISPHGAMPPGTARPPRRDGCDLAESSVDQGGRAPRYFPVRRLFLHAVRLWWQGVEEFSCAGPRVTRCGLVRCCRKADRNPRYCLSC